MSPVGFMQRRYALLLWPQLHFRTTASRLPIAPIGHPDWADPARSADRDRSLTVRDRVVATWGSAVPRIADAHGGAGCRTGCRLDGAHREYACSQRPTPYAASQPFNAATCTCIDARLAVSANLSAGTIEVMQVLEAARFIRQPSLSSGLSGCRADPVGRHGQRAGDVLPHRAPCRPVVAPWRRENLRPGQRSAQHLSAVAESVLLTVTEEERQFLDG